MSIQERSNQAIEILQKQSDDLVGIVETAFQNGDTDTAFERKRRWKERTINLISENISPIEGDKLRKKEKSSFIMGAPLVNLKDEAEMYLGFINSLIETLEKYPDEIFIIPVNETNGSKISIPSIPHSKDIFIIHGHDELNLLRLKEQIKDRWTLNPVVLSTKAGKGRTLIEKFEQEAQSASFALALFTPDDFVELNDKSYFQARPNVIFELGWFYGRLGRQRVCILYKENTKIPSDLDGISRVEFKDSITEVITEIEKELIAANLLKR